MSTSSARVFEDILGAMGSGAGGCVAGAGWGQHDVGGEQRWLGGLQLQNCCDLPVPCSWGGRKCEAGKAAGLCPSQPWHRAALEGAKELAWEGLLVGKRREMGLPGLLTYSQPHPSLALLNKTWWSDAGAGSVSTPVCFPAAAG